MANGMEEDPVLKWRVKDVLKKRDSIIEKEKSNYWQKSHKFGIIIPKSLQDTSDIDKESKTSYWREYVRK